MSVTRAPMPIDAQARHMRTILAVIREGRQPSSAERELLAGYGEAILDTLEWCERHRDDLAAVKRMARERAIGGGR